MSDPSMTVKLQGEHIIVTTAQETNAESLFNLELKNREFFQRYSGSRDESFYTVTGQLDRIRRMEQQRLKDLGYLFLIRLPGTDEVIGEIMLTEVVRGNLQSCWIGYFLDKDYNGKGYMTEAVKLVVRYAFEVLSFHRIEAGVMPHNVGSMKVLLKAGFTKEGIARKNVRINGKWEDHQTLAILEEDVISPQSDISP